MNNDEMILFISGVAEIKCHTKDILNKLERNTRKGIKDDKQRNDNKND